MTPLSQQIITRLPPVVVEGCQDRSTRKHVSNSQVVVESHRQNSTEKTEAKQTANSISTNRLLEIDNSKELDQINSTEFPRRRVSYSTSTKNIEQKGACGREGHPGGNKLLDLE